MLEDLDQVPWDKLKHAYGEASDVPDLIRALASPIKVARDNAYNALYSNIWHQNTVYEATAYAVPFLVEVLDAPDTQDRHLILEYLGMLANGRSYIDVHQHLDEDYPSERHETDEYKQRLKTELGWVRSAYEVVGDYANVYLKWLVDGDEETRVASAGLLCDFPEKRKETLKPLKQRLQNDGSLRVKIMILSGLANILPSPAKSSINFLLRYMDEKEEPLIRFYAATSLVNITRDQTPQFVLEFLQSAIDEQSPVQKQYKKIVWNLSDVVNTIISSFKWLTPEQTAPFVPLLINKLPHLTTMNNDMVVPTLLRLVFGEDKLSDDLQSHDLSDIQRQALQLIGEHALENKGTTRVNQTVSFQLSQYNLPSTPEAIASFLDESDE